MHELYASLRPLVSPFLVGCFGVSFGEKSNIDWKFNMRSKGKERE
jgi:hypothetical protein